MVIPLLLGGSSLVALPGVVRRLGRRLPPAEWARLCALALLVGAALFELGLLLYAAPTVLSAAGVHAWSLACEQILGPLVPAGPQAGWAAAVLAIILPAVAGLRARRAWHHLAACRADAGLGDHHHYRGHDLVILPADEPLAVAVGGCPSQILLSEGMLQLLSADQLDAVLRHEAAHLEHRHHRYLLLASAVEDSLRWIPGARTSAQALRTSLERWADEQAAGATPARRATVREALLDVTLAATGSAVAAFNDADTVVERLTALDQVPPSPGRLGRAAVYGPGLLLAAAMSVAVGIWVGEASGVVGFAHSHAHVHCPV